jgi:hypothetical protein
MHKKIVDEIVQCIDVAADFEDGLGASAGFGAGEKNRITWVAVKMVRNKYNLHVAVHYGVPRIDCSRPRR